LSFLKTEAGQNKTLSFVIEFSQYLDLIPSVLTMSQSKAKQLREQRLQAQQVLSESVGSAEVAEEGE
jgi:hypothetical protein